MLEWFVCAQFAVENDMAHGVLAAWRQAGALCCAALRCADRHARSQKAAEWKQAQAAKRRVSPAELAAHNHRKDLWLAVEGGLRRMPSRD
jgi:hypothetical protein